jgi:hypothetical protein
MECDEDLAVRRDATLADDFAMPTLHQRTILPGDLLPDGVILRSLMPADVDNVPITPGGHHAGDGAIVLQHGVGGNGCAMQDMIDVLPRNAVCGAECGDSF